MKKIGAYSISEINGCYIAEYGIELSNKIKEVFNQEAVLLKIGDKNQLI